MKATFAAFIVSVILVSTAGMPINAFAANILLPIPTVTFDTVTNTNGTSRAPPNTFFLSARADSTALAQTGGSTTSRSVTISFEGTGNPRVSSFQCSLDSSTNFQGCNGNIIEGNGRVISSQHYEGLDIGSHEVQVRAINSRGADLTPLVVSWTIKESVSPTPDVPQLTQDVQNQARNQTQQVDQLQNRLLTNDVARFAEEKSIQQNEALQTDADVQSAVINPPFKACDDGTDLAIYNILGAADIGEILPDGASGISATGQDDQGARPSQFPVSLIVYNDLKPTDQANQIINQNNRYLKGVLVSNPGNSDLQRSVTFEINKISTDCKKVGLIDEPEKIGGPSPGTHKPSYSGSGTFSPPFDRCGTTTGVTSLKTNTELPTDDASQEVTLQTATGTVNETIRTAAPGSINQSLLTALSTPPTPQTTFEVETGGVPTDVAKYTIRGTINLDDIKDVSNQREHVTIKIYNDPNKGLRLPVGQSGGQAVRVTDSNNQFAASFQINPKQTSDWSALNYVLHEISTECKQIPFVDLPTLIGTDEDDFRTQPRNGNEFEF